MISVITPALVKDETGIQWLHEAISSVFDQNASGWEMIIVNDHSPVDLGPLRDYWPQVRWLEAEGQGVSAARNQAAEAAKGELLLPLDADDKLAPEALAKFWTAWTLREEAKIIYSDVVMFGQDYARVYLAPEYDFPKLLHATYMTVGCLHRKEDWDQIGGWRLDMSAGLEDWEYWIAMGEAGVCGKRLAEPLYWYRRHPRGRLQWLKANKEKWNRAYQAMREIHRESYNGRFSMGCCGGAKGARRPVRAPVARGAVAMAAQKSGELVQVMYVGARKGDFQVVSGITRTRYRIPGQGELVQMLPQATQGVRPADVAWFKAVGQGREFKVMDTPKPAPVLAEAEAPAAPVPEEPRKESGTWDPGVMEPKPAPPLVTMVEPPDLQSLTVAEIRELEIGPGLVDLLIVQEREGKGRITVLDYLEKLKAE